MKMNRTYIIAGTAIILAGVGGYIVYRRINASAIMTQLLNDLDKHVGETGTADDLGSQGGALDPNYFESVKNVTTPLTDAVATQYADQLKKAVGNKYIPGTSDETTALGIITKLKNKAQVSQLSAVYLKKYTANMLDDLKTMDYTLFGLPNLNPVMPKIQKVIDSLPAK